MALEELYELGRIADALEDLAIILANQLGHPTSDLLVVKNRVKQEQAQAKWLAGRVQADTAPEPEVEGEPGY